MITFLAKVVANSSLYQGVPPPSENPESAPGGIDAILSNRPALEPHFGIHLDSDESDLEVPSDDEWSDDGKR